MACSGIVHFMEILYAVFISCKSAELYYFVYFLSCNWLLKTEELL